MERLSRRLAELETHYDIVVVGSGYGGGIAAARLARAGKSVCVLERGRELHPGEYPNRFWNGVPQIQARIGRRTFGSSTALFDFRFNGDINVLVGCGLGGTSLINAGVALRAEPRVFAKHWPAALKDPAVLEPYYDRVTTMLGSKPYPEHSPPLAKLASLERSALAMNEELIRPCINVTFHADRNEAGVHQEACTLCGDCVSGCNYGAKNTVLMNYLPYAHRYGAQIFTQLEVRTVTKADHHGWQVAFRPVGIGRERFSAPTQFVTADIVVLAAGTLGTTEILLRSRAAGLHMSDAVGKGFSGNGDALGVAYDSSDPVHGMGLGRRTPSEDEPVGPCIAGLIDLRGQPELEDGLIIEEASVPGALAGPLPPALVAASVVWGRDSRSLAVRLRRLVGEVFGAFLGPYRGPTDRTQTYMVNSSEDTEGCIRLVGDRAEVSWPDVADRPVFARENKQLQVASDAVGATYIPDPLWALPVNNSVITVHPLGGAVMADDATCGVVNDRGQVFKDTQGDKVHKNLYVADGSVIPSPLAANPLLTISALAERTCELLLADRKWQPEPPLDPVPIADESPAPTPGLRFIEALRGWFSIHGGETFETGAAQGRADGSVMELVLTAEFDDLELVLQHPETPGDLTGTVVAPELSPHRLTVTEGSLQLFVRDPDRVETVCMRYRMTLLSEEGHEYRFTGDKVLHHGVPWNAWNDSTTVLARIDDAEGKHVGSGVVRVVPADFARELTTMTVLGVPDLDERTRYLARFVDLWRDQLLPLYGGLLDEEKRFDPPKRPRRKKPRVATLRGEVSWFDGEWHEGEVKEEDHARVRLTRYRNPKAAKGPVVVAPGFGMTAHSFTTDTVEQNLAEALVDEGYDVWLFDYRACTDLKSAAMDFTLDDIARDDWPAAVARVIDETGEPSVQVVAHCVGSMTLLMALLWGMQGVRSAVCSQSTAFPVTSGLNRAKAAFRVVYILEALGIKNVTPDTERTWRHALLDIALSLVPIPREERCGQALCRWINAIYGMTHHHAQLSDDTHRSLNGLFGVGNLKAFEHLARIMGGGKLVDRDGKDVYLRHVHRLGIPIHFIVGRHNDVFLPEGTGKTVDWLEKENPSVHYTTTIHEDYGHLDCFIGRDAHVEVFPDIIEHLAHPETAEGIRRGGC